jgi:hypothetical protein
MRLNTARKAFAIKVVKDFPGNDLAVMSSHRFSTISLGFPTNRRHLPHPFLPSLNPASIRLCIASMNDQSTIRQSPGAFIANPFRERRSISSNTSRPTEAPHCHMFGLHHRL